MTVRPTAFAVSVPTGSTPTLVIDKSTALSYRGSVIVRNQGPSTVYLGGLDVDTDDGFPLGENESITFAQVNQETAIPNRAIYAVHEDDVAVELRVLVC